MMLDDATGPVAPSPVPGFRRGIDPLRHRNYRLLFAGQVARGIGMWMQLVATPLLVLSIGGSALDLGVVYALQFLPILLFGPLGGVLADRVAKRPALMLLQSASAAQALAFTFVVAGGNPQMWQICVLAAVMGLINAAEMPTRTSFVAELVPDDEIPIGITLLMVAFNITRILGPAIAGLIASTIGFAANFGSSFVAALLTLALIWKMDEARSRPPLQKSGLSIGASLVGGLRYVATNPRLNVPLGVLAAFGVFGNSFHTIAPMYALDIVRLDPSGYGLLIATMGIGALVAGLPMTLVSLSAAQRLLLLAPISFAIVLAALALNRVAPVAFLLIVPLGIFGLLTQAAVNISVQSTVPHEVRGRTMGIYLAINHGSTAIGALIAGSLAEWLNVPTAMLFGAAAIAVLAVALNLRATVARRKAHGVNGSGP